MNLSIFWNVLGLVFFLALPAQAGIFNMPHFYEPGESAFGVEPELTLTNGAGLAGNLKFTHGISDFSNATFAIGTGGGNRRFRIGGNITFDFIPDVDKQPGVGVAAQLYYYKLKVDSQVEVTAVPYIHKTFISDQTHFDPFVAVPFGMSFRDGNYKAITSVAFGSSFEANERMNYIIEMGVAINNSDTYFSGGVVYQF